MAGESEAAAVADTEALIGQDAAGDAAKTADASASASDAKPADTESKPATDAGKDEGKSDTDSLIDEAKDDKGKSPEKADGEKADAKKDGAPETYEAFNLPENMSFNDGALEQATTLFKKNGLNQEAAQEYVSLAAELVRDTIEGVATQQTTARDTLIGGWTKETKAIYGEKLAEAQADVNRAIDNLMIDAKGEPDAKAAAELRQLFRETKVVNHPRLFSLLARAGAAFREDKAVIGDASAQAKRSLAERLFPSMNAQE